MRSKDFNYDNKKMINIGLNSVTFQNAKYLLYKILMFSINSLSVYAFPPLTMIRIHSFEYEYVNISSTIDMYSTQKHLFSELLSVIDTQ